MSEPVIVMPHSRAAEEALLGSVIIDPEVISRISLNPDDFYIRRNAMVWKAIQELDREHSQIDFLTIGTRLDEKHLLSEIGGPAYLISLINQVPSSMHAESYAETIRERSQRRKIIQVAQDLASNAFDMEKVLPDAVSNALDTLASSIVKNRGARHISDYVSRVWDEIESVMETPVDLAGISTGFADMDRITGGLMRGEKILLSGPPGLGKSLFAFQIITHMAAKGHPVAIYEMEMAGNPVIRRAISARTKGEGKAPVTTRKMLTGKINDDESDSLVEAVNHLSGLPVYISDASEMTTAELRADLTRLVQQEGVEVFVLDYEGLLTDIEDKDEITRLRLISKRVKAICKDLNVCGIVISDMTKAGIAGERGGQGAVAGPARNLHDADQIIVMRLDEAATKMPGAQGNKTVLFTWEKMREGEAGQFMRLLKLAGYPIFGNLKENKHE